MPPNEKSGIYVASRASVPERIALWHRLRETGVVINSSWIDIAEIADGASFWENCLAEIIVSTRLILYVEPDDFPLRGALVEIGAALAHGVPVYIVAKDIKVDWENARPFGTWIWHPLVSFADSLEQALI